MNNDSYVYTRSDTIFLRCLAIILILNSHFDRYYPIAFIGTGGAIGNSIFFFLSSFGLYIGEKNKNSTFISYYEKRIERIYPSIWCALLFVFLPVLVISNRLAEYNILSFLGNFFYPPFWFIQALLWFYLFGYILIKKYSIKKISIAAAILGLIYIILYTAYIDLSVFSIEKSPIDLFFYAGIFTFGIYLGSITGDVKFRGFSDVMIFTIILIIFYGHKYAMLKGLYSNFQFVQHVLLFPLMYYFLKLARSPFVINRIMSKNIFSKIINWSAASTLQIYIVHTILARLKIYEIYEFPINLVLYISLTMLIVYLLNKLIHGTWQCFQARSMTSEKI